MRSYTVVLLYPDYLTGDFGAELFVEAVPAGNFRDAVNAVQANAFHAQDRGSVHGPSDFRPILVMSGEVEVVADATSF